MVNTLTSKLRNKEGYSSVVFLFMLSLLLVMMVVIAADFMNLVNKNLIVKHAMNRAVKAAVLQVDRTASDGSGKLYLSQGIFIIDDDEAEEAFRQTLSANLGIEPTTLTPKSVSVLAGPANLLEFTVLNDVENMPYDYHCSSTGKDYLIEHPSVVAAILFPTRGLVLSNSVRVGKLSSAQLINLRDV